MGTNQAVDIKRIFEAHEEELRQVEEHLQRTFTTDVALLSLIGRHIIKGGGKRMRPLFLIKSARLAGYEGKDHIPLGGAIETIHTASLLHDDVVDEADVRRGRPAAHSLWGNHVVILVGDYLYSTALRQAVSFESLPVMAALSKAVSMMARGELLQLQKSGDIDITEEEYTDIAASKTGVLFSTACRIGAILGRRPQAEEEALAAFGLKSGVAFQVADDILDYHADERVFGKRLGTDLREGKITLPLICLLKVVNKREKDEIRLTVEKELISEDSLSRINELMEKYHIHKEAFAKAKALVEDAKAALSVFPPSAERDEMFCLADYALQRRK